jgi:hypothetical protein
MYIVVIKYFDKFNMGRVDAHLPVHAAVKQPQFDPPLTLSSIVHHGTRLGQASFSFNS